MNKRLREILDKRKSPMKKLAVTKKDIDVLIAVCRNPIGWDAETRARLDSIYQSLVQLRESYDDGAGF